MDRKWFCPFSLLPDRHAGEFSLDASARLCATERSVILRCLGFTCHQGDVGRHTFSLERGGAPATESRRADGDDPLNRPCAAPIAKGAKPNFAVPRPRPLAYRAGHIGGAQIDRARGRERFFAPALGTRTAPATAAPECQYACGGDAWADVTRLHPHRIDGPPDAHRGPPAATPTPAALLDPGAGRSSTRSGVLDSSPYEEGPVREPPVMRPRAGAGRARLSARARARRRRPPHRPRGRR